MNRSALCFACLLLLATRTPAEAQGLSPFELTAKWTKECMAELNVQPPASAAQLREFDACRERKRQAWMPKTPEEKVKLGRETKERMEKDVEQSRARQSDQAAAEEARLAEVRAGKFGPQMQVAVLCREDLQRNGLKPQAAPWADAVTACVERSVPPASPHVLPALGSDAWCALETRRKNIRDGIPDGAVYSKDPNAKAVTHATDYCATLAGKQGIDRQITALCNGELADRFITPGTVGANRMNQLIEQCEDKRMRESKPVRSAAEQPFGDATRVHDYLNALVNDDRETLRSIDLALSRRTTAPTNLTLLWRILQTYFERYPTDYAACLEPDAPTILVGDVYDEVTKDGTGREISRRTVDSRRPVPVNRRFHALAKQIGIGQNVLAEAVGTAFTGVSLRGLSAQRVNQAVSDVMRSHRCDSSVVRRLEAKLIQYAAVLPLP